ncbi:hypothetical protein KP509_36G067400 [Ceratopteris richardii]|uniref:Uncharacterized protein n=1 Tax=Ceratopteris richardii TaxID=49495 RepID=A0A8T2QFC4_CERRI|nr:hypothetical protein KP509_36G067400 [Ceratopteris richardii]
MRILDVYILIMLFEIETNINEQILGRSFNSSAHFSALNEDDQIVGRWRRRGMFCFPIDINGG